MYKNYLLLLTLLSFSTKADLYLFEINGYNEKVDIESEISKSRNKVFFYHGTVNDDNSLNKYQLINPKSNYEINGIKGFSISYKLGIEEDLILKCSFDLSKISQETNEKISEGYSHVFENTIEIGVLYEKTFENSNLKITYRIQKI